MFTKAIDSFNQVVESTSAEIRINMILKFYISMQIKIKCLHENFWNIIELFKCTHVAYRCWHSNPSIPTLLRTGLISKP